MNYKFAYSIGFHPWEDTENHSPFVKKITEMFEREEAGKKLPSETHFSQISNKPTQPDKQQSE